MNLNALIGSIHRIFESQLWQLKNELRKKNWWSQSPRRGERWSSRGAAHAYIDFVYPPKE